MKVVNECYYHKHENRAESSGEISYI